MKLHSPCKIFIHLVLVLMLLSAEALAQARWEVVQALPAGQAAILDGALTDGNGTSGSAVLLFGVLGAVMGFMIPSMHESYKTVYKVR